MGGWGVGGVRDTRWSHSPARDTCVTTTTCGTVMYNVQTNSEMLRVWTVPLRLEEMWPLVPKGREAEGLVLPAGAGFAQGLAPAGLWKQTRLAPGQ